VVIIALTRDVSPALARSELTHLARTPIDIDRARAQHAAYEVALRSLGCHVERLAAGDEMPDSVFIEDTALVLDEAAIITRPGAASRRGEIEATMLALQPYRPLIHLEPPGTLDGGDVLVVGRTIFVGLSSRSDANGVAQLREATARLGYQFRTVEVKGCLHLKSGVTALDDQTLLIHRDSVALEPFAGFELVDVHPSESAAANVLRVGARLLAAAAFPRTADLIRGRGYDLTTVDVSELAKAEGAVTCCSLIFDENAPGGVEAPV
jgi:dimethylargininase